MGACAEGGLWTEALDLLDEMRSMGMQPDVVSYSAAIRAMETSSLWEGALAFLFEMSVQGVAPNEISYDITINACSKGQQWGTALALLDKIRADHGQDWNLRKAWNSALSACEYGGQKVQALELLRAMKEPDLV